MYPLSGKNVTLVMELFMSRGLRSHSTPHLLLSSEQENMSTHSRSASIDASIFAVDPELDGSDSVTTASDTESYAGSINHHTERTFNPVEYLLQSLESALSSLDLDRSIVLQSQISGELNSTSKELVKTIEVLEQRIRRHVAQYEQMKKNVIPGLVSDIAKSERKAEKLAKYLKREYPIEYSKSQDKVLNRITKDNEDLYV